MRYPIRITIPLDAETSKQIEREAAKEKRTVADVGRKMLQEAIAQRREKFRRPARK